MTKFSMFDPYKGPFLQTCLLFHYYNSEGLFLLLIHWEKSSTNCAVEAETLQPARPNFPQTLHHLISVFIGTLRYISNLQIMYCNQVIMVDVMRCNSFLTSISFLKYAHGQSGQPNSFQVSLPVNNMTPPPPPPPPPRSMVLCSDFYQGLTLGEL